MMPATPPSEHPLPRDRHHTWIWRGVCGLLLSPLLTYAVSLMRPPLAALPLVALAVGSSLLFVPSLLGVRLVRRPGAALAAALCSGGVLALTTAFPADSLVSMLLCGLLAEGVVALITRYQRFTSDAALATGGLLGGLAWAGNVLGHQLTLTPVLATALLGATVGAFVAVAVLCWVGAPRPGAHRERWMRINTRY
jgi:ABC-type thiamin/hydroxymethylpyrimidine transport system permease subunit